MIRRQHPGAMALPRVEIRSPTQIERAGTAGPGAAPDHIDHFVEATNLGIHQLRNTTTGEIRRLDRAKSERPLPTGRITSAYVTRFGELVLCDPSGGGFEVLLPTPKPGDVGKHIWVKEIANSANTITLRPVPTTKINGFATTTISFGLGSATIITDGRDYWTL